MKLQKRLSIIVSAILLTAITYPVNSAVAVDTNPVNSAVANDCTKKPTAPSLGSAGSYGLLTYTFTNAAAVSVISDSPTASSEPTAWLGSYDPTQVATLAAAHVVAQPNAAAWTTAMGYIGKSMDQARALLPCAKTLVSLELTAQQPTDPINGTLAPGTFRPGVYTTTSAMSVVAGSDITLDANNDPNALFIFIIPAALVFGASVVMHLENSAQAKNVYWFVGTDVGDTTFGASSILFGNFVGNGSLTFGASVDLNGRVLAANLITW
jgi:hypothetical protein